MRLVTSPPGRVPAVATGSRERRFRELFRHRDFLVLWIASTQSQAGDQLGRVALSVLVFESTGSGIATAATYALTYLPAVVGGVLLAGLADRLPRRGLLVVCDLIRALVFAVMAIPALPLWLLCSLLVTAVLAGSPYGAAAPAIVADLFTADAYVAAQGLRTASAQAAQVIGFAVGGVVVAAIGAHVTLAVDAATFAVGALLLQFGMAARPAVVGATRSAGEQLRTGIRAVAGDRRLRILIGLTWLYAWWIIPEGLAAPYAAATGSGPVAVGFLLAAAPAGSLLGVLALTRWVPDGWRRRLLSVLAPASGLPLVACVGEPPVAVAVVLWATSGVCTAYLVLVVPEFVAIVPADVRGQAIGIAGSGLLAAQGVGLLVGGGLVAFWSVGTTIAVGGAIGVISAAPLALAWHRAATVP